MSFHSNVRMQFSFWKKNWPILYYVMAIFNVCAIGSSVYFSQKHIKDFDRALSIQDKRAGIYALTSELSRIAHEVNAPGNDLFGSGNVMLERKRYEVAAINFAKKTNELNSRVQALDPSNPQRKSLLSRLGEIERRMASMDQVSTRIFTLYQKGDRVRAGAQMAEMDRRFAFLNEELEALKNQNIQEVGQVLHDYRDRLKKTRRLEYSITLFLFFTGLVTALFGRFLASYVKEAMQDALRNFQFSKAVSEVAIIAVTDKSGIITEVNDNFCALSGFSRSELIGKNYLAANSVVYPQDFFETVWDMNQSKNSWSGEIENRKKTGERYFVKTVVSPIRSLDGEIEQFVSVRFDVTEQKRLERDLLEAQKISKVGFWRYDLITGQLEWSSETYRIFEISEPQDPTQLFEQYRNRFHPDDLKMLDSALTQVTVHQRDFEFEHRILLDSGKRTKYVRGIGKVARNSEGKVVSISGTCQDLTDSRSFEIESLSILKTMSEGLVIQDQNGEIEKFNPEALRILGLTEEQLPNAFVNNTYWKAIWDDGSPVEDRSHPVAVAFRTHLPVRNVIMGLIHTDGNERWINLNAVPFDSTSGRRVACTFSDVTEIVLANRELGCIFNYSRDLICVIGEDGIFRKVSPSFIKALEWDEEELFQKSFFDVVHVNDQSRSHVEFFKIHTGRPSLNFEIRMRTKSDKYSFISWSCVYDPVSKQVYATGRDVTELRKSEKELLDAQSTAKIGSWTFDLITGALNWSSEHYRIFEIDESQSPDNLYVLYRDRIHPDDLDKLDQFTKGAIERSEDYVYNHRVYLDAGKRIKHVRGIGKVLKDENGKPVALSGTCQDLTDYVALEQKNDFILKSTGVGIWIFNPTNNELMWDESMYKLFEISPSSFSGHYQAWESSLTEESKNQSIRELQLALSGEKELNMTFEIKTPEGKRKYIGGRGVVTRNENGEPLVMYGINWDRTPEVTYEHELKSALDLNEAIRRSARFMIITTDLQGQITGFNKEAERALGYRADETVGKMTPSIFHVHEEIVDCWKEVCAESKAEISNEFEALVFRAKQGLYYERDWTFVRKDGNQFPVRLNITGLRDQNGMISGFLGIGRDITEDIALQKQLAEERAKSLHTAKLASLGEMSAGIAHEINNPLAIITGGLSVLTKFRESPEKFDAKVEMVRKSAHRIEKIVNGLKKFARSSDKNERALIAFSELLSEVLILTEAKSKRHDTPIHAQVDDGIQLVCDVVEIEQVLVNLINNAIDAVKERDERWVKLNAFTIDESVVIQVIDSGKGISREIEDKLFQPFFTTKVVGEGTGLGLSIARGIIEQHQGSIAIKHEFKNTCFEIRLPIVERTKSAA